MVCKGVILDIIPATDSVVQVVIRVKKNDSYFPIAFTAYKEIKILIQQVNMEKGDAVKIEYYIKSKKWQDKYFTSAIIEKIKVIAKKSPQMTIDMETGEIFG
jgi:predicted GIY-YIG superfamily endonuclease